MVAKGALHYVQLGPPGFVIDAIHLVVDASRAYSVHALDMIAALIVFSPASLACPRPVRAGFWFQ